MADRNVRGGGWLRLAAAAVLPGLLVTSISGCSDGGSLGLDVSSASSGTRGAALDGIGALQGSVIDGKACFWVTVADGSTISLVWPAGSVAKDDPLRVEDATGKVLATVGDTNLLFAGMPGTRERGCHPGSSVFYAGEVSRGR